MKHFHPHRWLALAGFVGSAFAFIAFEASNPTLQLPCLILVLTANIVLFLMESGERGSYHE